MASEVSVNRVYTLSRNDLEDCFYVISESRHEFAENFYYEMHDRNVGDWRILITASTAHMVVGVMLGHLDKTQFEPTAVLDYFFVGKRYQQQGIGARMLQMYENCARGEGISKITLQSAPGRAFQFYKNRGYLVSGGYKLYKDISR